MRRSHRRLQSATLCLIGLVMSSGCGGSSTSPSNNGGNGNPGGGLTSSTMTATVDGKRFTAVTTLGLRVSSLPNLPNGTVGVTGTDGFVPPYNILSVTVPGVVGTYPLTVAGGAPVPQNASYTAIITGTTGAQWNGGASFGGSGTITLSTLTAAGATGTFSFTLVPSTATGAAGSKVVTDGAFNVKF